MKSVDIALIKKLSFGGFCLFIRYEITYYVFVFCLKNYVRAFAVLLQHSFDTPSNKWL